MRAELLCVKPLALGPPAARSRIGVRSVAALVTLLCLFLVSAMAPALSHATHNRTIGKESASIPTAPGPQEDAEAGSQGSGKGKNGKGSSTEAASAQAAAPLTDEGSDPGLIGNGFIFIAVIGLVLAAILLNLGIMIRNRRIKQAPERPDDSESAVINAGDEVARRVRELAARAEERQSDEPEDAGVGSNLRDFPTGASRAISVSPVDSDLQGRSKPEVAMSSPEPEIGPSDLNVEINPQTGSESGIRGRIASWRSLREEKQRIREQERDQVRQVREQAREQERRRLDEILGKTDPGSVASTESADDQGPQTPSVYSAAGPQTQAREALAQAVRERAAAAGDPDDYAFSAADPSVSLDDLDAKQDPDSPAKPDSKAAESERSPGPQSGSERPQSNPDLAESSEERPKPRVQSQPASEAQHAARVKPGRVPAHVGQEPARDLDRIRAESEQALRAETLRLLAEFDERMRAEAETARAEHEERARAELSRAIEESEARHQGAVQEMITDLGHRHNHEIAQMLDVSDAARRADFDALKAEFDSRIGELGASIERLVGEVRMGHSPPDHAGYPARPAEYQSIASPPAREQSRPPNGSDSHTNGSPDPAVAMNIEEPPVAWSERPGSLDPNLPPPPWRSPIYRSSGESAQLPWEPRGDRPTDR